MPALVYAVTMDHAERIRHTVTMGRFSVTGMRPCMPENRGIKYVAYPDVMIRQRVMVTAPAIPAEIIASIIKHGQEADIALFIIRVPAAAGRLIRRHIHILRRRALLHTRDRRHIRNRHHQQRSIITVTLMIMMIPMNMRMMHGGWTSTAMMKRMITGRTGDPGLMRLMKSF